MRAEVAQALRVSLLPGAGWTPHKDDKALEKGQLFLRILLSMVLPGGHGVYDSELMIYGRTSFTFVSSANLLIS